MSDVISARRAIVTFASWEPRWKASVRALLSENDGASLRILYSARYTEWTKAARDEMISDARAGGFEVEQTEIDLEQSGRAWREAAAFTIALADAGIEAVSLDGTTMPREVTWFLLHATGELRLTTDYIYVPAGSYGEWLSKESLQPRLVLKRSGVLYPDKPTCVMAMSGFDIGRLNQLVSYFEPAKVEVAKQVGERYGNAGRNNPQLSEYGRRAHIFDFDGFDLSGASHVLLKSRIEPLLPNYNVLLASLGPKLSAVTAFEITEELPEVALVYIPSSSYNREYSKGEDMSRRVVRRIRRGEGTSVRPGGI
ncbi:hypothetical protein, partial [Sphingomonas sp.]|uniref:hypothetical protein n=1 Tax=Sphingomonas sp. TaxID=28214 RepID=UPI0025EA6AA7